MYTTSLASIALLFLTMVDPAQSINSTVLQDDGQKNLMGEGLELCSSSPLTGYDRQGYCKTLPDDSGTHTVCAQVDNRFLEYTKSKGNDLSTPRGGFPGLVEGDSWCLCALRWRQAQEDGKAPKVRFEATNEHTLDYVDSSILEQFRL